MRKPVHTAQDRPVSKWILPVSILGSALGFVDSSVVNIALPVIQDDLGAPLATAQWVTNGYLLTLASLVLIGGAAGDRWGTVKVFAAGLCAFALASLLCALAPSAAVLIGARILQGAGAAFLMPASLALLSQAYQGAARDRAIGIWAASGGILMAMGPPLGGWLVEISGWPSLFLINLPIAALALWLTTRLKLVSGTGHGRELDIAGALLAVATLALMTYGLVAVGEGRTRLGTAALVLALPSALAFIIVEHRQAEPMVPTALFAGSSFSGLNILTVLLYGGLGAAVFLLPFAMMRLHDYSSAGAGLAFLPLSLTFGIGSIFSGRLTAIVGVRPLLIAGPLAMGTGFAALAVMTTSPAYAAAFLPGLLMIAIGLTLTVPALTSAIFDTIPPDASGTASGINNAAARTGGLLATAALGIAFRGEGSHMAKESLEQAYRLVMWAAAVSAVAGAITTVLFIRGTSDDRQMHDERTDGGYAD